MQFFGWFFRKSVATATKIREFGHLLRLGRMANLSCGCFRGAETFDHTGFDLVARPSIRFEFGFAAFAHTGGVVDRPVFHIDVKQLGEVAL